MFELHDFRPSAPGNCPPVLMVPGAFSSGRVWHASFVPAFLDRGYRVHTLTFGGHGRPRLPRLGHGRAHYLNDLRRAVDRIGGEPLIIAHSMGGLTTMRLLAERDLPAAALLSPVPPSGMASTLQQLLRTDPGSALKWAALATDASLRHLGQPPRGIFGETSDPDLARRVTVDLGPEAPRALAQLLGDQAIALERINTPVHFYAAAQDTVVPAERVAETAAALDAPLTVYPTMAHSFHAERDWSTVAADIANWFDETRQPDHRVRRAA